MKPNYSDVTNAARAKMARYTAAQCAYAIADCHDTLKTNPGAAPAYLDKLWAEIDAARGRAAELQKPRRRPAALDPH